MSNYASFLIYAKASILRNYKIIYLWAHISQAEVCIGCSLTISRLRAYFGKVCSEHTPIKEEIYYIRSTKGRI